MNARSALALVALAVGLKAGHALAQIQQRRAQQLDLVGDLADQVGTHASALVELGAITKALVADLERLPGRTKRLDELVVDPRSGVHSPDGTALWRELEQIAESG